MTEGEWEPQAENWLRWARTPGFDAFWYYKDAFFDTVVPTPGRRTLDIGCGEGRAARELAARGHHVAGIDSATALVRAARDEDTSSAYVRADGAALPFRDGAFDVVVAYNSLQVVSDMAATVWEAGRVLETGGMFCFCVAHPVGDIGGRFDDDGAFRVRDRYFVSSRVDDHVRQGDHEMRFLGWTFNVEHYSHALEIAGLHIQALREPLPAPDAPAEYDRWRAVPLFLQIRAVKSRRAG